MNKRLEELTEIELVKEVLKCDKEIIEATTHPGPENYPGYIMRVGDFYCEKSILIDELLRRKNAQKT